MNTEQATDGSIVDEDRKALRKKLRDALIADGRDPQYWTINSEARKRLVLGCSFILCPGGQLIFPDLPRYSLDKNRRWSPIGEQFYHETVERSCQEALVTLESLNDNSVGGVVDAIRKCLIAGQHVMIPGVDDTGSISFTTALVTTFHDIRNALLTECPNDGGYYVLVGFTKTGLIVDIRKVPPGLVS